MLRKQITSLDDLLEYHVRYFYMRFNKNPQMGLSKIKSLIESIDNRYREQLPKIKDREIGCEEYLKEHLEFLTQTEFTIKQNERIQKNVESIKSKHQINGNSHRFKSLFVSPTKG